MCVYIYIYIYNYICSHYQTCCIIVKILLQDDLFREFIKGVGEDKTSKHAAMDIGCVYHSYMFSIKRCKDNLKVAIYLTIYLTIMTII